MYAHNTKVIVRSLCDIDNRTEKHMYIYHSKIVAGVPCARVPKDECLDYRFLVTSVIIVMLFVMVANKELLESYIQRFASTHFHAAVIYRQGAH